MKLFCLLPIRNGGKLIHRYFNRIAEYCDGVIALDDGSTDDTYQRLSSQPLVRQIISTPRRQSYAGWDDSRNRSKLLQACEAFAPDWLLWLDADEEIPACDWPLLRPFLQNEADPRSAYGFEVLRLIGDHQHYDQGKMWAYRLMAFRHGYTLPGDRLHFDPVPVQIAKTSWRRTRLRIAHSAGIDGQARRRRFRKYQEADPDREWQDSYENVLAPPGHLWEIKPLPAEQGLILPN